MDLFKKGWFTEEGVPNAETATLSIKCKEVLYHEKSKFQDILVFESEIFGRCLVLDNAIQCTERDEFSYQEMITFLPLNSHPAPKKVLIIGGGDGGVAREVLKHPSVEQVIECEIDEAVVRVSKKYFPGLACSYENPKLELKFEDGFEFVKCHKDEFDVIITDSSDPIGPAEVLFQKPYYVALWESLREGGIICSQAESYWFDIKLIRKLYQTAKTIYKSVSYATISVPSYPSGQIGFLIACKDKDVKFGTPINEDIFDEKIVEAMDLKFYSRDMHKTAFTLPPFLSRALNEVEV